MTGRKVFIVQKEYECDRGVDHYEIMGVFANEKLANDYINLLKGDPTTSGNLYVVEEETVISSLKRFSQEQKARLLRSAYQKLSPAERIALGLTGE